MMRPFGTRAGVGVVVWMLAFCAQASAVEYFPLQQVKLLESPFSKAQDRDIDYLMSMDVDRLLAPYLDEAGLETGAPRYGNWESSGLGGHVGGHYLSALSLAWAATGRSDVGDRLDYMLGELRRAQQAHGDGYLGGVPDGDALWAAIAGGEIRAEPFALNDRWVPWYNLHKVFAGLRDAWIHAGRDDARDMLVDLADWLTRLVDGLSDEELQAMLDAEHGGMNEVLADVADITGDVRYLRLAKRFSHRQLLDPLLRGEDRLTGMHANTQIPKVVGFERIAQLGDDDAWHTAAEFFWDTVVDERSVAIGGNSVKEHFHARDDFSSMIAEVQGPETCNTYNMLRLTRLLYARDAAQRFVDYYERALYNHILSSQDPETGGLVYFTPMRPQHYRVYSQVHDAMWCCVGSGIENHVRYGEFIYAYEGDSLYVNLFIPSRLNWPEQNLVVRQENRFPDTSGTRIVFERDADVRLELRYPSWATTARPELRVNGQAISVEAAPGTYIQIERHWQAGDTVELSLPMDIRAEALPDGSDYYAILFGPVVLAAKTRPIDGETLDYFADDSRMGHIAAGPICPVDEVPVFVSESPDFADHIERVAGADLRFRFADVAELPRFDGLELIPFFRLHRSRYMLYWPFSTPAQLERREVRTGPAH